MLVFEATAELQGQRETDYHWAEDGELVYLPALDCGCPDCGCTRGFVGLASRRPTTTAKVVDRPGLTKHDLCVELAQALHAGDWIATPDPADELVDLLATEVIELASQFGRLGPGAIIEREGDGLATRVPPGAETVDVAFIDALDRIGSMWAAERRASRFD